MQGSTFFIHFHLNYYILTKKHLKHLQILVRKLQLILMCSYFIYFKPLQFSPFLGFDICLIFNVVFFPWLAGFSFISYHLKYICSIWISNWKMEVSCHGFRTDLRLEFFLFFWIIHVFASSLVLMSRPQLGFKPPASFYFLHRAGDFAYILYTHVWETFE